MNSLLFLLVAGCGSEPTPTGPGAGPADAPPPEEGAPDVKFDLSTMKAEAETIALVPSPAEMQKAVEKKVAAENAAERQ